MNKQPKVSVIVTTIDEEDVINTLLKSIKRQSYANIEIILVDNPRTKDRTREIAKKYTKKVFVKGPERSVQRNFGVSKAKGKYVIILDADMILTPNVVKECVGITESKDYKALVIPEKSFGTGFWTKFKIFEREFYEGDETIEAARFFDKKLFENFGGYDVNITGPEDFDLPLRMKKKGYKIGRIKTYILHNEKNFSPIKSAKKKFYYAYKASVYLKKHPEMAIKQGNLIFRPVFFKKWKKMVKHPLLTLGMFLVKTIEMTGALLGFIYSKCLKN